MGAMRGVDPTEMLALARLACDVPDEIDDAPTFAAIRALLDIHDRIVAADPADRRRIAFLVLAATTARTPDVPVPDGRTLGRELSPDSAPRSAAARSA
jgi:hypothetical protein